MPHSWCTMGMSLKFLTTKGAEEWLTTSQAQEEYFKVNKTNASKISFTPIVVQLMNLEMRRKLPMQVYCCVPINKFDKWINFSTSVCMLTLYTVQVCKHHSTVPLKQMKFWYVKINVVNKTYGMKTILTYKRMHYHVSVFCPLSRRQTLQILVYRKPAR